MVGRPLSGKTRAVYEVLKKLEESCFVIKPRPINIEIDKFRLPIIPGNRKKVLFLDDLHIFAEKENFDYLFEMARKNNLIIVATCRSGFEYDLLETKLPDNLTIECIFDRIVTYDRISESEAQLIASDLELDWEDIEFDGTIGSLLLKLGPMKKRYKDLPPEEKDILRVLKSLYCAGISEEGQLFLADTILTFTKAKGIINNKNELNHLLKSLISREFIENPSENLYRAEEVYLEKIFDYEVRTGRTSILDEIMSIFSHNTDVLVKAALKSYSLGLVKLNKYTYIKMSIAGYEKALSARTFDELPFQYAEIQNHLGNAYLDLAEVEQKENNIISAIKAYQEALKIRTLEEFPAQYSQTQNNLGAAYWSLSNVEKRGNNINKAIKAYEEALKIRTLEEFPIQYAATQNNLGIAYSDLALLDDRKNNIIKAIKAHEEALKIRTLTEFPIQYAQTQNNLGTAYCDLAEIEDKKNNIYRAINACEEALKIRTFEKLPVQYALTQNNMGVAYSDLSTVEDRKNNTNKAIAAYEEALKVRTLEEFPIQHAQTMANLGTAHWNLAEVEDRNSNLNKAISAYEEVLKIYENEKLDYFTEPLKKNIKTLQAQLQQT